MLYILGVTNEGEKDRWENQAIEEHFPSSAFGLSPALPGELWRIPRSFLLSAHSVEPPAKAIQATPLAGPCAEQTERKETCPGETSAWPGRLQMYAGRLSSCTSQAQLLSLWKTPRWQILRFLELETYGGVASSARSALLRLVSESRQRGPSTREQSYRGPAFLIHDRVSSSWLELGNLLNLLKWC